MYHCYSFFYNQIYIELTNIIQVSLNKVALTFW